MSPGRSTASPAPVHSPSSSPATSARSSAPAGSAASAQARRPSTSAAPPTGAPANSTRRRLIVYAPRVRSSTVRPFPAVSRRPARAPPPRLPSPRSSPSLGSPHDGGQEGEAHPSASPWECLRALPPHRRSFAAPRRVCPRPRERRSLCRGDSRRAIRVRCTWQQRCGR
ncbi:Uncharacterised protein [Chlamydia trachomatis]|nr:Uncharacterised protein [Chlamydia trachomatis]